MLEHVGVPGMTRRIRQLGVAEHPGAILGAKLQHDGAVSQHASAANRGTLFGHIQRLLREGGLQLALVGHRNEVAAQVDLVDALVVDLDDAENDAGSTAPMDMVARVQLPKGGHRQKSVTPLGHHADSSTR
jgi:hypothetical protein